MKSDVLFSGNFLRVLTSESLNTIASSITLLALPIVAITALNASPIEVGWLGAASTGAPLIFGLSAGVIADKANLRTILIVCGVLRMALLASVPVVAYLGSLSVPYLCIIGFLLSAIRLIFDSTMVSVVPIIVCRNQLSSANGWFEASYSAAQTVGPALFGILMRFVTVDVVFFMNSFLYLTSTLSVGRAVPLTFPSQPCEKRTHFQDIAYGLQLLWRNSFQRAIAIAAASFNLFHTAFLTVFMIYALRTLNYDSSTLGLLISFVGLLGIAGALLATRIARSIGVRAALIGSLIAVGPLGIPILLAHKLSLPYGASVIGLSLAAWDFAIVVHIVIEQSVRQATVPHGHLSRIAAITRFVSWGVDPIGAFLGGLAANTAIGARGTLAACLTGMTLSGALLLLFKNVRKLSDDVLEMNEIPNHDQGYV